MTSPSMRERAVRRRATTLLLGLAAALLAVLCATPSPAGAADLSEFNPGNIITDQVFFDEGSMSAATIQAFLDVKGSNCSGGYCLKAYRADTATRAATTFCPLPYQGAGQETAAMMIYKVAQACGINPQVLLVTLQKEQGLVTATNPAASKYNNAMGYGCPDTAACDSQYYGLQNQLYSAASQFQRYVTNPTRYSYRAGMVNSILYHPYNDCGRASVYIQNGATAALYNYTPYVPNQAALNAGYGSGDSCSAYGNRNFFSYFTDWFGSTQSTGSGAINLKYRALGGTSSVLGAPVSATGCGLVGGGCGRAYQNGSIYWSPASGAAMVQGEVLFGWWSIGGVDGSLGYPVADSAAITGGKAGAFQGGSLYWSPATGAAAVGTELLPAWWGSGGITGPLGYPVASSSAVPGGKAAAFQGGSVYWSAATGGHWLSGAVLNRYWGIGSTTSSMGFPTSDVVPTSSGTAASFQGGSIYASAGSGAAAVEKELLTAWWTTGGVTGPLGWPVADSGPVTGGKAAAFQGGSVYWSAATGGHWLTGDILNRYWSLDGPSGSLGFPTSDVVSAWTGKAAAFEGGSVYSAAGTGAFSVAKDVLPSWWTTGGAAGPLGWPTADTRSVEGGKSSAFERGTMFWSTGTGGHWLAGDVLARYTAPDAGPGLLGFPLADQAPVTGGAAAAFEKGSIYSSPATGAHITRGEARGAWWALGGIAGPLGFPTDDTGPATGLAGATGQKGRFSGGDVYWSKATGGRAITGPIRTAFDAAGGSAVLGFPIADQGPVTGGEALALQDGSIYWSAGTGAHAVRGEARGAWWALGGIAGPLGFPTADTSAATGFGGVTGQKGRFSGGDVYWSKFTGGRAITGPILTAFDAAGGSAALGFPIADQGPVTGGTALALQDASIYWSAGTGAHVVRGDVRANWWGRGGITGPLGFPTSDTVAVTGLDAAKGQVGTFSNGAIYLSAATGGRVLSGDVLTAYQAAGAPGVLGFPVADQGPVTGGQAAALQAGSIYWSAGTGAHVVRGEALFAYWGAGAITGVLGFPTADTTAVTGGGLTGTVTAFQNGSIYATSTTGARVVRAVVDGPYRTAGGPGSAYGWPTSSSYPFGGGFRNDFQSGQITG
jgi:uncharacterized protein with LGFP repeats